MKSMFSEPMSINFELPVRYSTFENISEKSKSIIEEIKLNLIEEGKDGFFDHYIQNAKSIRESDRKIK